MAHTTYKIQITQETYLDFTASIKREHGIGANNKELCCVSSAAMPPLPSEMAHFAGEISIGEDANWNISFRPYVELMRYANGAK